MKKERYKTCLDIPFELYEEIKIVSENSHPHMSVAGLIYQGIALLLDAIKRGDIDVGLNFENTKIVRREENE